ncbi:MAG TPA: cytochrome c3 family protein, partial [Planctomycetaceae bacterium]|nr:cytochrome c3 family protein [Planctomycetaceae bacterium]
TRVHDLPDFVYFNHSIHIAKGVDCRNCHGEVANMPLMKKAHSLQMDWCLDCHRHPEPFSKGDEESTVFAANAAPRPPNEERGVEKGVTSQLTNCWVCHR